MHVLGDDSPSVMPLQGTGLHRELITQIISPPPQYVVITTAGEQKSLSVFADDTFTEELDCSISFWGRAKLLPLFLVLIFCTMIRSCIELRRSFTSVAANEEREKADPCIGMGVHACICICCNWSARMKVQAFQSSSGAPLAHQQKKKILQIIPRLEHTLFLKLQRISGLKVHTQPNPI